MRRPPHPEAGRPSVDQLPEQPQLAALLFQEILDQLARAVSYRSFFTQYSRSNFDARRLYECPNLPDHALAVGRFLGHRTVLRPTRASDSATQESIPGSCSDAHRAARILPASDSRQSMR